MVTTTRSVRPLTAGKKLDRLVRIGPYQIRCSYRRDRMLATSLAVGQEVRIHCPDNHRLHNQLGQVERVEEWGAHLLCPAAATGRYRAGFEEMELPHMENKLTVTVEFTGNMCDVCGSLNQKRTGTCITCQDCGTNSGCA